MKDIISDGHRVAEIDSKVRKRKALCSADGILIPVMCQENQLHTAVLCQCEGQ